LFKLINEDGIWQKILKKKYLTNQTIEKAQKKSGRFTFLGWFDECQTRFSPIPILPNPKWKENPILER
jgi:hypothetical protein